MKAAGGSVRNRGTALRDRAMWWRQKLVEAGWQVAKNVSFATLPPVANIIAQQEKFDALIEEFNTERLYEALNMATPDHVYRRAQRSYTGVPELDYPFHDRDVLVTACGRICMHRKKINVSTVLAGQRLGIKEVDNGIWLVSFMTYDLGYIDLEQKTLQTIKKPFGTKVSPMS